jgi:hypothetical protein
VVAASDRGLEAIRAALTRHGLEDLDHFAVSFAFDQAADVDDALVAGEAVALLVGGGWVLQGALR